MKWRAYKDRWRGDFGGDEAREVSTDEGRVHRVHSQLLLYAYAPSAVRLNPAFSDDISQYST